jgi:hypothetical protein
MYCTFEGSTPDKPQLHRVIFVGPSIASAFGRPRGGAVFRARGAPNLEDPAILEVLSAVTLTCYSCLTSALEIGKEMSKLNIVYKVLLNIEIHLPVPAFFLPALIRWDKADRLWGPYQRNIPGLWWGRYDQEGATDNIRSPFVPRLQRLRTSKIRLDKQV